MYINNLILHHFKNYEGLQLQLSNSLNIVVGKNGAGKTNLLDAIYYLAFGRSALHKMDSQNIAHQSPYFILKGNFRQEKQSFEVTCSYEREKKKKTIQLDHDEYQKLSEHVGKIPAVIFLPNDIELVKEGSEQRRKFFDHLICQLDLDYLNTLILYNQLLKRRNETLKDFAKRNYFDETLLKTYDDKMAPLGEDIFRKRQNILKTFMPYFNTYHKMLTGSHNEVNIEYLSCLNSGKALVDIWLEKRKKDCILQYSSDGIHKDDYQFQLNKFGIKLFGSQGQQKSFVLILKLAKYEMLRQFKKTTPILLLDDVFDKLDKERIEKLIEIVSQKDKFEQVFISDADSNRYQHTLQPIMKEHTVYRVNNNSVDHA